MLHRFGNYFPELETAAESLWRDAELQANDLYTSLVRYIERENQDVTVQVVPIQQMARRRLALRHHTPGNSCLSEALSSGSRTFQLAVQIGLLHCRDVITEILKEAQMTSDDARALGRVVLAGYFAGAVVMPYIQFLHAR